MIPNPEETTARKKKANKIHLYYYMFNDKAVCQSAFRNVNEVDSKALKSILFHTLKKT